MNAIVFADGSTASVYARYNSFLDRIPDLLESGLYLFGGVFLCISALLVIYVIAEKSGIAATIRFPAFKLPVFRGWKRMVRSSRFTPLLLWFAKFFLIASLCLSLGLLLGLPKLHAWVFSEEYGALVRKHLKSIQIAASPSTSSQHLTGKVILSTFDGTRFKGTYYLLGLVQVPWELRSHGCSDVAFIIFVREIDEPKEDYTDHSFRAGCTIDACVVETQTDKVVGIFQFVEHPPATITKYGPGFEASYTSPRGKAEKQLADWINGMR